MMAGDPNAQPDEIVMIDGQAYSARAVREQQMMHRQMVLQQQQEEQLKQHELNMRQREMDDDEDEQAEAELRMQAMQRQAQMQMQVQARAQQQHLLAERERERVVQAQQEQHQQQQHQMHAQQQQQMQLQQQQQQQAQLGRTPAVVGHGQQTPSQTGFASTPQPQAGQFQTFRAQSHVAGSPVVPVQTEAQIQQMREMQAQQMREVQMRHQTHLQQEMQRRQQQGQDAQQGRTQITKAEAMAMRDRERERLSVLPSERPVEMADRATPGDTGRIISTPMPMGPPSSIAQSARSATQTQAGSAVRLAQMQLQAGLGLGMPVAPHKRDPSEQPNAAVYPPPRAISMVVHGNTAQGQRGSVVPSIRDGQEQVEQSAEREVSNVSHCQR